MTRKEFLKLGAVAVGAGLAPLLTTRCSSSTTPPPSDAQHSFTSTNVNSHTHSVTLDKTDVQTPPFAGVSGNTSTSSGHVHAFALTQGQLTTVLGGGSVTITTGSSVSGGAHTHDVTITKWF